MGVSRHAGLDVGLFDTALTEDDFHRTFQSLADATSPDRQRSKKQYEDSTKAAVAGAFKFAQEKRSQGWTRQDAAASLKSMLESDTGDEQ
jgi:hypothetical protein